MAVTQTSRKMEIWDLVSQFFQARSQFQETYDYYETKVLGYAAERGVDRRFLRLDAHEVSGLLDFKKLERLRNDEIETLRAISHTIFRTEGATDILDRYISEIYHEISILKEEQYKVERFAPAYSDEERAEYDELLDEVHQAFPRKVHHVFDLFQKAQERLEEVLSRFSSNAILLRSAYLFGEETFGEAYPGGVDRFFEILFPGEGALKGYYEVARSFAAAGFDTHAKEALVRAMAVAEKAEPERREHVLARIRELQVELDERQKARAASC